MTAKCPKCCEKIDRVIAEDIKIYDNDYSRNQVLSAFGYVCPKCRTIIRLAIYNETDGSVY